MKTLLYLLALASVVPAVAAQPPMISGHMRLSDGQPVAGAQAFREGSIPFRRGVRQHSLAILSPWIGGSGNTLSVPMSARWLGSALETEQEAQPLETPTMRRSKWRTLAGVGLMGIGGMMLVVAQTTNCLDDDQLPDDLTGDCITRFDETSTTTSTTDGIHWEYESSTEYGPDLQKLRLFGATSCLIGALLTFVWGEVPVEVDARQDGIHLSKSFSW